MFERVSGSIDIMMGWIAGFAGRIGRAGTIALALAALGGAPLAQAQIRTVDPNSAIDADLAPPPSSQSAPSDPGVDSSASQNPSPTYNAPTNPAPATATAPLAAPDASTSYQEDDLIGAAEGVFGKGAEGLAGMIEKILKDQGRPNAYISGREASGAFVVGLRYGSGTLYHTIEGKREVYWTGPSIGFDVGGNASNTFVLVYNLYDTQELYHRFPAAEGTAYLVGGFTASYLRWGNVVLIPIRLGVGYRLGVNAGYMKFTEKRNWLPF
jgi:hypothetical protein